MRSILTDSCFAWAGFDFKERTAYRTLRRNISNGSGMVAFYETELAQQTMEMNWDRPMRPNETFFVPGDDDEIRRWVAGVIDLLSDVEMPWRDRNVQGLAVILRALAEHVGIGSLAFGSTYTLSAGHPPIPQFVLGPVLLGPDLLWSDLSKPRLEWGRRRIECLLEDVTLDKYDGLTMLAGFAHPSRFGSEAYLDTDLTETGPKRITRFSQDRVVPLICPIVLRLLAVSTLLVRAASHART